MLEIAGGIILAFIILAVAPVVLAWLIEWLWTVLPGTLAISGAIIAIIALNAGGEALWLLVLGLPMAIGGGYWWHVVDMDKP